MDRNRRIACIAAPALALGGAFLAESASASEGGLVLLPDPQMLLVLVVFFGVLVLPFNNLLLKPIFRVLDEREAKTAGTRRRAESLAAEAESVLTRYRDSVREVRTEVEEQRKQTLERARSEGAGSTAAARREAEIQVARAREEMAESLEAARVALRGQTEDLAREIAARALGRTLP